MENIPLQGYLACSDALPVVQRTFFALLAKFSGRAKEGKLFVVYLHNEKGYDNV